MKLLLFWLLALVLVQTIYAQTDKNAGTFTVYVGNTAFAEETYTSQRLADETVKTESQVTANGNTTRFVTTTKKNLPAEFLIETGGKQILNATFANSEAKILITGQAEKIIKTAASVILENGVWSQYLDLLDATLVR